MNQKSHGGTLYGVGVGPGDPELLTLKAVRIIRGAAVIAVPYAKHQEESLALHIAQPCLSPAQRIMRLHFPMTEDACEREARVQAALTEIRAVLDDGEDVAFLTEGDPLLHSTFLYLLEKMDPERRVEIVPGISSVMASAAGAAFPLARGNERLAVLPAVFMEREDLRTALETYDTVVLMKVYRVLDGILDLLAEMDLLAGAVLVERASQAGQIVRRDVAALRGAARRGECIPYFSLLLVRGRGGHGAGRQQSE